MLKPHPEEFRGEVVIASANAKPRWSRSRRTLGYSRPAWRTGCGMPRRGRHPTRRRRGESDEFREADANVSCCSKLGKVMRRTVAYLSSDAKHRMGAPDYRALDRRVVRGHCVAALQCPPTSPVESREEPRLTSSGGGGDLLQVTLAMRVRSTDSRR
jgi:hypothetical protein